MKPERLNPMQVIEFASGHKHIHRIQLDGSKCLFSAYFAPNGVLTDAGRRDAKGREYDATKAQRAELAHKLAHLFPAKPRT